MSVLFATVTVPHPDHGDVTFEVEATRDENVDNGGPTRRYWTPTKARLVADLDCPVTAAEREGLEGWALEDETVMARCNE